MAALQTNLLDVPASHGVKIEDAITPDGLDDGTNSLVHAAGLLLVAKICDALVAWGYDDEAVRKVGELVAKNLLTCESELGKASEPSTEADHHDDDEKIEETVRVMLKSILDKNVPRTRNVHVNSNEPVVLVNTPAKMDRMAFHSLVDETVTQLQQEWHILPVRVYAGPFAEGSGEGFSITLLNVVNTDIGGPSMVQLLDSPCDAPEWSAFARREVWRERERLSREDREISFAETAIDHDDDNASERSFGTDNDSVDSEPLMNVEPLGFRRQNDADAAVGDDNFPPSEQVQAASENSTTEAEQTQLPSQPDEHLHPDQITSEPEHDSPLAESPSKAQSPPQELDVPDRHIDHPTWERHQDSMSLLDMIRSQASLLAPFGQGSASEDKAEEAEEDVADTEPQPTKANSASEEEFVVV